MYNRTYKRTYKRGRTGYVRRKRRVYRRRSMSNRPKTGRRYNRRKGTKKSTWRSHKATYVADQAFVKFRFYVNYTLPIITATNSFLYQTLLTNGAWLPDPTAFGTANPNGWSFQKTMYKEYVCYGSKYKFTFNNGGVLQGAIGTPSSYTSSGLMMVMPTWPSSINTTSYPISSWPEMSRFNRKRFIAGNAGQGGKTVLSGYVNMAKLVGKSKTYITDNDVFSSQVGVSNPSSSGYYNLLITSDNSQFVYGDLTIDITYYCKLYNAIYTFD